MNNQNKKNIAILGSTGSIGTQTLEVVEAYPNLFTVEVLTAGNNTDLLIQQAKKFNPNVVIIANEDKWNIVKDALQNLDIKVYAGNDAIDSIVEMDSIDLVVSAMVGFAGLKSTLNAIKAKKTIALANKETLVVAGELIIKEAVENKVSILPVDSEHSAIFQCIAGEFHNEIEKLIVTASGGPFFGKTIDDLKNITPKQALKHPNWEMGNKITIDSATLMNKGLEVIEAHWLFGVAAKDIEVVVHPQSIVHSLVQFTDGSIKAQLGLPDMKLPIHYAMSYPQRVKTDFPRFSFKDFSELNFYQADIKTFRNLDLAYQVLNQGGNAAAVLNAANEIAVHAFLNGQIGFLNISDVIENSLEKVKFTSCLQFEDYLCADLESREVAKEYIKKNKLQ